MIKTDEIKWNSDGLIPAILQDRMTGQVLMLAYMNEKALRLTIERGEAYFWSRSRQELWHKGATSGNIQVVKEMYLDCDQDTLLVFVEPLGPACHTGEKSCFGPESTLRLDKLAEVIALRKAERPEGSYTTYLFEQGLDKILKKVGEESAEVIIAAKNEGLEELAEESADLLYHLFTLFAERGLEYTEVLKILEERGR